MKIVILISQFLPKWVGGTEIATKNIAGYLARNGHEVHIITSLDKGLPKKKQEDNFFIHRVSHPKIKIFGYLVFWIKCFFSIKKIKPDIVHSQGIQMGIPSFLAKKIFGTPYIVYCRGSEVYLPWKFKKIISKIVFNSADAVIALTDNMKNEIQKNYEKNIIILPNGVDFKKFLNFSKQTIRDKFKINPGEKIIVFVGSLRPVKGVEYLIEAFNIIKNKAPATKLFLVGDGEKKQSLEDLVRKNNLEKQVNFIGQVQNDDIPEYMAIADIFVLPSLSEGFPGVILESMASGLSVVATKVGGLPELIKDGENGFLVEPKNPEQISEKVLLLLEDDKLREKISNNNKEKVKRYSWENVIDKIEKIYSEAIAKNNEK